MLTVKVRVKAKAKVTDRVRFLVKVKVIPMHLEKTQALRN